MHSSATGRSAVPAVTTATRAPVAVAGRQATVVPVTVPPAGRTAICSGVARVSTTGPSAPVSSSFTMAAQWSGSLPGP